MDIAVIGSGMAGLAAARILKDAGHNITIFASVNEDVDLEYAMIDGTIVKVHRHGQGAKGGLSNSL